MATSTSSAKSAPLRERGAEIIALPNGAGKVELPALLQELGREAHVYVGTGLGSLHTIHDVSVQLHESQKRWDAFWAGREQELQEYLHELAKVDGTVIEGGIEAGKLHAIRDREKNRAKLQEKWNAPEPPWNVSANLIWNIQNTPAAMSRQSWKRICS
mgnify:CR=1 FL=1